ncbi:hypothetical protein SAMN02910298_02653 [Pseudobutyrivibrio sp. YE44]|uniref:hypothetical protein n=1 Tax=Pseudobutyrivibrio sp. YE44 TaxID=1520802 RepID=UPI00087FCA9A|nr:hypothetical protein [Pseudobutyrivibrio sp. YE44]SDB51892.1 hypothetical protein SAMN02910298_02653 [Pseudobutyrivibrio sp. YE44]
MNGLDEILSHTSRLENLSVVLLVISISCFIGGVVLWFVLDIAHSIRVLTGLGAAKSIDKLSEGAKQGRMRNTSTKLQASLNWNTSTKLDRSISSPLSQVFDTELLGGETELLSPETELLSPETELLSLETEVLNQPLINADQNSKQVENPGFNIEEDIIITGTDKKLG